MPTSQPARQGTPGFKAPGRLPLRGSGRAAPTLTLAPSPHPSPVTHVAPTCLRRRKAGVNW